MLIFWKAWQAFAFQGLLMVTKGDGEGTKILHNNTNITKKNLEVVIIGFIVIIILCEVEINHEKSYLRCCLLLINSVLITNSWFQVKVDL